MSHKSAPWPSQPTTRAIGKEHGAPSRSWKPYVSGFRADAGFIRVGHNIEHLAGVVVGGRSSGDDEAAAPLAEPSTTWSRLPCRLTAVADAETS